MAPSTPSANFPLAKLQPEDRKRMEYAVRFLQSDDMLLAESVRTSQSVAATRIAYEKMAAGIKDDTTPAVTKEASAKAGNLESVMYRKNITAAEDDFKPAWMGQDDGRRKQHGPKR